MASAPRGDFSEVLKTNYATASADAWQRSSTADVMDTHCVSCSNCWSDFPVHEEDGGIPRGYACTYTQRLVANEFVDTVAIFWEHLSTNLVGEPSIIWTE
jgi:hypothetical protein